MIDEIANLPEVSFIENKTLDDVQAEAVTAYQNRYEELTGESLTLRRADHASLELYALSTVLYQVLLAEDKAGKMDLLKYSYGDFLENLGALRSVTRLAASAATVTVRFTLSEILESAITIPAGTRVSNGELYFEVDEDAEIAAGEEYADIICTCQTEGENGNGLIAGAISTLVDPIAYVDSASNIDESSGGSDVEDDESFAERIYLAPSSYSVAGPPDSYIYHVMSYSTSIGDVEVTSPTPCVVEVRFLMADGSLPEESVIESIYDLLYDGNVRPLSEQVNVMAPSEQEFDIDLTYYINQSNSSTASAIQAAVESAIEEYIEWQTCTIGRDVNPSALTQLIVAAGAKRVEIASPEFTEVPQGYVARIGSQVVTYGGLEDD